MICIIPARGGSKRLPRKNILLYEGMPLVCHAINTALDSGLFERVIVSTEDKEIALNAVNFSEEVEIHRRKRNFGDADGVESVCIDVINDMNYSGWFCCTYATAVLLNKEDYKRANSLRKGHNGVMGVSEYIIHPYKALDAETMRPMFPDKVKLKSQMHNNAVASNGTFYWTTDSVLKEQGFYTDKLAGCLIPHERALDIDTDADYQRLINYEHERSAK